MAISILIIDDDEVERKMLRRDLQKCSSAPLRIDEVSQRSAGRDQALANRYDCILLDYWLPDGDGLGLLRDLTSQRDFDTPILVLTMNQNEADGIEAIRCGAKDYLFKEETSGRQLFRAIRYAIERQRVESGLGLTKEFGEGQEELVAICACCKQIRDAEGGWHPVESYFTKQFDIQFTHSYCTKCFETYMQQIRKDAKKDDQ